MKSPGGRNVVVTLKFLPPYFRQTYRYCTFATDTGMLSNVATTVEHCTFTGANSYFTSIAAGGGPTVTVKASVSEAANAGNNTETVKALIS